MAKKGQGATEYLIILAVVVIIALIVIGVLGGLPGIGRSSSADASEAYWATTEVGVSDWYISTGDDQLVYTLKNNQDTSLTILDITIDGTANSTDISLSPGESTVSSLDKTCTTQGDPYEFDNVVVNYQDVATSANYTFTGTVSLVGECAQ